MLLLACAAGLTAQVEPEIPSLAEKAFRDPSLIDATFIEPIAALPPTAAAEARQKLSSLSILEESAFVDRRSGRFGMLLPSRPLIPGAGKGNDLSWRAMALQDPVTKDELERAAGDALVSYIETHKQALGVDSAGLATPHATADTEGQLIQIRIPRVHEGLPVRNAYVTAVLNRGNLVLLGMRNWAPIQVSTEPLVSLEAARIILASHLTPLRMGSDWLKNELVIVPTAPSADPASVSTDRGYLHRLAWAVRPDLDGQPGQWEALIDAHSGELLSFLDTSTYATSRTTVGGVFPAHNNGADPDGTEQSSYPMPFTDVASTTDTRYTDTGGNLAVCVDGNITTSLNGAYAQIFDLCGTISETSAASIDLGTSSGTDCSTPAGSSSGNTRSARTTYYHLNRAHEMGRGRLPGNPWLESSFAATTNYPSLLFGGCNALWDGSGVLFTSSYLPDLTYPTGCSATGELPGVVVHEWAHGLDDNDADGTVSNPPEGIADVVAAFWLDDSCIARGFFQGTSCSTGTLADGLNACLSCDGVREIDWRQRAGATPHDIEFIDTYCPVPLLGAGGPCGGSVHCEGHLVSEAAWDLSHHDLLAAPFSLDAATALELSTRLFYTGSGLVGNWFQCIPGQRTGDGCNADSGYLNLLAADDDNGDLADGTPHMSAIHAAFSRHGIACDSPQVEDSGCAAGPETAPLLTVEPLDRGARLTWNAVDGAQRYDILRSEGSSGCRYGRAKIGETDGLEFADEGLLNGFEYHYIVVPVGSAESCVGPASTCESVSPAPGPNLSIDIESAVLTFTDGDGDPVVDNCESADVAFSVHNLGSAELTNVRIVDVEAISHPETVVVTTAFPQPVATSMAVCDVASSVFSFVAGGLTYNDTVEFRVRVTADELGGVERTGIIRLASAETDFQYFPSKTFSFEADLENWQVVEGTFDRTDTVASANGSSFHLASSSNVPNQCDEIRSPLIRLDSSSTLSLWTSFDIEPVFDLEGTLFWFDRANIAIVNPATGTRTPVVPDGGRLYNAGGTYGTCVTADQQGWADSMPSWAETTFSASALGSAGWAGQTIQLDVGFGTDDGNWDGVPRDGFRFDEVTVTSLELLIDDQQSDLCEPPEPPTCDQDGICEPGEDCGTCGSDCISGTGAFCGDGICDAADGEDCLTCEVDCAGKQKGKADRMFCCGAGGGVNPVGCDDVRCTTNSLSCNDTAGGTFCCGDGVCEALENACSCSLDCGEPASTELPSTCQDGLDNDCDGGVDCDDTDCGSEAACQQPSCDGDGVCEPGEDCTNCSSDCDGVTKGKPSQRYCCGDGTPQDPEGNGAVCDSNF